MLADMAMELEAARQLVYVAAAKSERGDADLPFFGAAAKCYASDVAMRVTTDAVQLLGGAGYTRDFPLERMMRDAKITQIYEGTNQVQRIVMARQLLPRLTTARLPEPEQSAHGQEQMSVSALRVGIDSVGSGWDEMLGEGSGSLPSRFGTSTTSGAPGPRVTRTLRAQAGGLLHDRAGERRRDGARVLGVARRSTRRRPARSWWRAVPVVTPVNPCTSRASAAWRASPDTPVALTHRAP